MLNLRDSSIFWSMFGCITLKTFVVQILISYWMTSKLTLEEMFDVT